MRFIWKPETLVKRAARLVRPVAFSRTLGRHGGEGVEVQRQAHLAHRLPERLPGGMPHGLHVPGAGELEPAQAHLRHAVDLAHRRADVAIGQAGQPDVAIRIVAAEVQRASRCRCGTSPRPPRGRPAAWPRPGCRRSPPPAPRHAPCPGCGGPGPWAGGCPSCRPRRGRWRPSRPRDSACRGRTSAPRVPPRRPARRPPRSSTSSAGRPARR